MHISSSTQRVSGTLLAIVLLVGCNGSALMSTPGPSQVRSAAKTSQLVRGHSWMSPQAKSTHLLYVSSNALGTKTVYVFSYHKGSLMGELTDFQDPQGMCVDKVGDVFITDTPAQQIDEYAHGGTSPIAILSDSNGYPQGCSVDPKTGDLAVADLADAGPPSYNPGNIAVYAGASGTPTYYADPAVMYRPYFCSYDNKGNLFIDGGSASGAFQFASLPTGSSSFTSVTLNQYIQTAGGVLWDGEHVAVADEGNGYLGTAVYEFTISGSTGTLVGTTPFPTAYGINQFWINPLRTRIVAADYRGNSSDVGVYNYPAGGSTVRSITVGAGGLFGVTVSKARRASERSL